MDSLLLYEYLSVIQWILNGRRMALGRLALHKTRLSRTVQCFHSKRPILNETWKSAAPLRRRTNARVRLVPDIALGVDS